MPNFDQKPQDPKLQDSKLQDSILQDSKLQDSKLQGHKGQDQKSASRNGRSLVARWRVLARQRLDHLIELYESGRWKLYYKEQDFLALVQEARAALKVWEQLAPPDPVLDKPVEVALVQDALPANAATRLPGVLLSGIAAEHDPRKG